MQAPEPPATTDPVPPPAEAPVKAAAAAERCHFSLRQVLLTSALASLCVLGAAQAYLRLRPPPAEPATLVFWHGVRA